MPLQKFPLLQDNTRLIRFKDTLYKVKVKYKMNTFPDGDVLFSQTEAHDEVEQTFRAVLYLHERNQTLKTIATANFLIQPYKITWSFPRKCNDYCFQQNGKSLKVFDHMFEFHISKRESEKCSPKNVRSENEELNYKKKSRIETEGDKKLKQAVVIVTDLNTEASTRFGRTKDGQLFWVYQQKTTSGQESSPKEEGRSLEVDDHLQRGNKSQKKQKERKGQPEKRAPRKERDEAPHLSDKEEMIKQKSNTPRDKFSLRLSEVRELKRENVQPQRLRSRKMKHSDQEIIKKQTFQVSNQERRPESKRYRNYPIQRDNLVIVKHEKTKALTTSKNSERQIFKAQIGTNLNTRTQLKEGAHIKRLKEGRTKRRYIPRGSKTALDTSSQSELDERSNQSTENDTEKNYSKNGYGSENRRSNQRSLVSTSKQLERSVSSEQSEQREISVSSDRQVETRRKSRRNTQGLYEVAMQQDLTETESDVKFDEYKNVCRKLPASGQMIDIDSEPDTSPRRTRKSDMKRKVESVEIGEGSKIKRQLRSSSQKSDSSVSSSDRESGRSPRKSRRLENIREPEDEAQSTGGSQDSARSRKVKLYASRHSPQVVIDLGSKPTTEISSPRVSTVLPVKRNKTGSETKHDHRSRTSVTSPRITRQSLHDDESRRIHSLREERPTQIYRDIMLTQRRDRYMVEQAENAETDKLRQLYEPSVPGQSTRNSGKQATKRRKSSGIWGKILDTLVTPSKKYMYGTKN